MRSAHGELELTTADAVGIPGCGDDHVVVAERITPPQGLDGGLRDLVRVDLAIERVALWAAHDFAAPPPRKGRRRWTACAISRAEPQTCFAFGCTKWQTSKRFVTSRKAGASHPAGVDIVRGDSWGQRYRGRLTGVWNRTITPQASTGRSRTRPGIPSCREPRTRRPGVHLLVARVTVPQVPCDCAVVPGLCLKRERRHQGREREDSCPSLHVHLSPGADVSSTEAAKAPTSRADVRCTK